MSHHDAEFKQLLALARVPGDDGREARDCLLVRYSPYLTLLAETQIGRRLEKKVEPADLVQETFLEALGALGRFRGTEEAQFSAWLRRILASRLALLIRQYCGTQARDIHLERELDAELDRSSRSMDRNLVARGSSPSQRASSQERIRLLADALACLSREDRQVIVLRSLEHLDWPDVARQMGKTRDAVERRWYRVLPRLGAMLGNLS